MTHESLQLIAESIPPIRERKGGAVNLVLAAVLLEAARMIDEGVDVANIENAAHGVFQLSEGIISLIGRFGPEKLVAVLKSYADDSDPEEPLFRTYQNFFSPAACLGAGSERRELFAGRNPGPSPLPGIDDPEQVDRLKERFMGTSFMTAAEVVDSGIQDLQTVDRLCRQDLGWKEGPFSMMNRIGIGEAMRVVTKKLEQSHRREINFPVPDLLIEQVRRGEPWPLNSHARGRNG